jgi:hypothetical protein
MPFVRSLRVRESDCKRKLPVMDTLDVKDPQKTQSANALLLQLKKRFVLVSSVILELI